MKIFLYDGSFDGLLTGIYESFYSKVPPSGIYYAKDFDALLIDEIIHIETDEVKYKKVKNAIITKVDYSVLKNIYLVYLSNHKDKGIIILNYLKFAFKVGSKVHNFLNLEIVKLVDEIKRRINLEAHRYEGFIRFNLIDNKFLYSSIEPDNDILELIIKHFTSRFSNEYFIIHDIKREKALIYNINSYEIIDMTLDDYELLKDNKDEYSLLWKEYFKSTNIKERENPKLQKRMMPKRYWNHLPEIK